MPKNRSKTDPFEDLTWDDLEDWAGSSVVSRGRSYQHSHRVQDLARTPDGGLIAWVLGTEKYATRVDFGEDGPASVCTCPYWTTCKHAVAVVLEYLESAKRKTKIPTATERDPRLAELRDIDKVGSEEWDEYDEGDAEDAISRRTRESPTDVLRPYLNKQTKEQLVELIDELATSFPAVQKALQDRSELAEGTAQKLVKSVRREIRELGTKPGWQNYWDGEGYTPDYSGVRDRLTVLLERGRFDEIVELGKELRESGVRHVEMSHDEGETATQIVSCLNVVFRALSRSSLPSSEQALWAIEAALSDDYDLCQGADAFWEEAKTSAADWNVVADQLLQRLKRLPAVEGDDSFSRNYRRDRVTDWLIHALQYAGREDEIIPLCRQEAEQTGSYVRLVSYLVEADRQEEAEQWIRKGIEATQVKWPGIAHQLRQMQREMRASEKDWLRVAAFYAEDFFAQPTLQAYQEMQKAAERAEVWPAVRAAALHYLETGELPKKASAKGRPAAAWPLPETGLTEVSPRWRRQFPIVDTLIEVAIAEKRTEDIIRWYDRRGADRTTWGWSASLDDTVARALADTHPERAVAIWKQMAEDSIAQANKNAYQTAGVYLRQVHRLLKQMGKEKEWQAYVAELRQANVRKRRFLEVLDNLSGKRIIET
jgi:uncharacterized Zn finger protein